MQKNIDQQFQEALGKLEGDPQDVVRNPEANWATIEGMLDGEKRKRRGAWIWMATAASVALMITLGYFLMPERAQQQGASLSSNRIPEDSGNSAEATVVEKSNADSTIQFAQNEQQSQTETYQKLSNNQLAFGKRAQDKRKVVRGGDWKTTNSLLKTQNQSFSLNHGNRIGSGSNDGVTQTVAPLVSQLDMSTNLTFYSSPSFTQVAPNFAPAFHWDLGSLVVVNGTATAPMTGTYTVTTTDAASVDATGSRFVGAKSEKIGPRDGKMGRLALADSISVVYQDEYDSESYAETVENPYFNTVQEPLSTFSIDVDRASYTNHRRFVESGELPPKFSVRAEEFINYFDYTYAQPHGRDPFSILPEVTTCPWNPKNKLVRIALKGREVAAENVPPSNIVFLLDVSGSMADADKLPLLKQAMGMLTEKLREQDKVSIVVYAGAAGLVLPPTSGSNKQSIMGALDRLEAGGSTAGGEGIELAYATAKQNFIKGGNNRVILATDGDFNVGTSDETGLEKLIVEKREEGVFLSVLGFGEGNLQDSKMELLADKGNGNYNYIDSDREAHKVLVREFGGTLYTIAKDVKIQVEFNPAKVQSYRLVGYENRKLRNEDFANDKIDAGELGAGHTVTALYEVVPAESGWSSQSQDLKYQTKVLSSAAAGKELLTVKLRYKDPDGSVSKLLTETLIDDGRNIAQTTNDFRWAVAVAEYALILRESEYKGMASFEQVLSLAKSAMAQDTEGIRKEFVELVTRAAQITQVAKGN